jgi:hypothetical protein
MPAPDPAPVEGVLFEGGPPNKLQTWLGLIRRDRPRLLARAGLAILIGWVPLALLALAHGDLLAHGGRSGFLSDFAAHARFLLAVPLLVLAETACLPQLTAIAWQFLATGIVAEADHARYQAAIVSTRRLMNSTAIEVSAVLTAYGLMGLLFVAKPPAQLALWHGALVGGRFVVSPAGWWLLLVSLPLLIVLALGWLWRLALWVRFLWLMNRLGLRLNPAHPDHAAGLEFIDYSLRAFVPLGFIVGVLAAGPTLNLVVHSGVPPMQFQFTVIGVVAAVLVVFVAPLLVFSPRLAAERRRGIFLYGALAAAMGREFEKKWFGLQHKLDQEALAASDFSATTDLYAVAANVYAMQVAPVALKDMIFLALATLAPFVPVVLVALPLDVVLDKLAGLFL